MKPQHRLGARAVDVLAAGPLRADKLPVQFLRRNHDGTAGSAEGGGHGVRFSRRGAGLLAVRTLTPYERGGHTCQDRP